MLLRGVLISIVAGGLLAGAHLQPLGVYLHHCYSRPDALEWERVKSSVDIQSLQSFVSRYPNSRYTKAAEKRLALLQPVIETASGPEMKLVLERPNVVRVVADDSLSH